MIKYIKKGAKVLKNLSIVFASPGEVELVKSETEEIKDNEVLNELNNEVLNNSLDSHFVNLLHYLPYVESLI